MPRSDPPKVKVSEPDFWRCPHCRTPNLKASYLTHCVGCGTPRPVADAPVEPSKHRPDPTDPTKAFQFDPAMANSPGSQSPRRWRGYIVALLTWSYAGLVLVALALSRLAGDFWWLGTAILFMPRWVFLAPLPLLALAAAWARWFRLWPLQAAIALVVLGPLMAVSLPVRQLWSSKPEGIRLRVMTFNVGTEPLDISGLTWLIEHEGIDLICLQEVRGYEFPLELDEFIQVNQWHRSSSGMVLSRFPILQDFGVVQYLYGDRGYQGTNLSRVRISPGPGQEIDVLSAHLPSIRYGLYAMLEYKPGEFQFQINERRRNIAQALGNLLPEPGVPLLIGADLNTPSESPILDPLRPFLRNAFDHAGWGYGYTKPSDQPWIRIDHVLASDEFAITRSWVGPALGSDHLPMIAEVILVEAGNETLRPVAQADMQ